MVQRFFRILFWIALVVCFVMAVIPAPVEIASDKYQHIAAFATLTALALLGYREVNPLFLFAAVAAFGGMIEVVQGFSFIGPRCRYRRLGHRHPVDCRSPWPLGHRAELPARVVAESLTSTRFFCPAHLPQSFAVYSHGIELL